MKFQPEKNGLYLKAAISDVDRKKIENRFFPVSRKIHWAK